MREAEEELEGAPGEPEGESEAAAVTALLRDAEGEPPRSEGESRSLGDPDADAQLLVLAPSPECEALALGVALVEAPAGGEREGAAGEGECVLLILAATIDTLDEKDAGAPLPLTEALCAAEVEPPALALPAGADAVAPAPEGVDGAEGDAGEDAEGTLEGEPPAAFPAACPGV